MNFWEKVKKDLQKGLEEGITYVVEGASIVKKKAEELTEEGKRRYRLYELKTKVQQEIAELGGKVYELSGKVRNPMLDSKVKAIKARIKKLELEIIKLEGIPKSTVRKTTSRASTARTTTKRKASGVKTV
ncbi:MAG TPA: hypothetical protein VFG09_07750 [Thermodesulfovibrionales bacterium]|nr:hypothetical protein [Thermodesulfovibrionales bacterium]